MKFSKFQSQDILSHSCRNKSKTVISNQRKFLFSNKNSHCRKPITYPFKGEPTLLRYPRQKFIGLCETKFELRYRNNLCSFENRKLELKRNTNRISKIRKFSSASSAKGGELNKQDKIQMLLNSFARRRVLENENRKWQ